MVRWYSGVKECEYGFLGERGVEFVDMKDMREFISIAHPSASNLSICASIDGRSAGRVGLMSIDAAFRFAVIGLSE